MTQIRATSESLAGVAGQLTAGARSIRSQLANLRSLVDGLVSGELGTSDRFTELTTQWDDAGGQLTASLEELGRLLDADAHAYAEDAPSPAVDRSADPRP